MSAAAYRSGFVALVGRPNVGKSTLMNRLVGAPVSITTPKPQTTRTRIMGVRTAADHQAVFLDTPGIHQARDLLNRRMVRYATLALHDADLIVMLVEPPGPPPAAPGPRDRLVLEMVQGTDTPALLVVNKIDRAAEAQVLKSIAWYADTGRFAEIFPLSALTGRNVERLEARIPHYLPEGPRYFDPEQVTDQPEQQVIAELIRQEVFRRTHQEVPYSTAVRVEHMETRGDLLVVHATIYVERESQKGIVIGKGGSMLKTIGRAAREKMEHLLGVRVYLEQQVRVLKDWSRLPRRLDELGYPEE